MLWRKILTPSGIEPATCRFVAQCLNHYATARPQNIEGVGEIYHWCFFLPWSNSPQWAKAFSLSRIHNHTQTHNTRQDSSGRVISLSQRPLPDNTQHSQQTDIHAPGGIRTHNPSQRAAADLRLRPRGHWDRQICRLDMSIKLQTTITNNRNLIVSVRRCELANSKFQYHCVQPLKSTSYRDLTLSRP